MPKTPRWSEQKWLRIALPVVLVAFFWLNMTSAVKHMSQTYDEGFHLFAAWRYVQCGDFGINSEHPPLMKLIAGTTLKWSHVPPPAGPCGAEPTTKGYGYVHGVQYLYQQGLDADAVLYKARRGVTVFAVALALLAFFFAKRLFGYWPAVVAMVLVTFDPTVLAHGALLTTDVPLSACLLATVFACYCFLERPALLRLLPCGVALGLTLAAKHSGILAMPITFLLFVFAWVQNGKMHVSYRLRPLLRLAVAWLAMLLLAVMVLWAVYGFHYSGRPGNAAMTLPLADFLAQVRAQGTHGFLSDHAIPFAARWHLLPQPYLYGLTDVLSIMVPGLAPYLLGKLYPHGQWFYFPVVFVLKNTLPFFALLVLGLAGGSWLRPDRRWKLIILLTPVVVIWSAAMDSGLNIGYRHVLTTFAFLCIAAAGGSCWLARGRRSIGYVVALLLVLHAATSLHAWPDYLPYVNEAFGGKTQAYRYMTDANVDWSQGVLETRDWLAANHVTDCWMSYDGAIHIAYYKLPCHFLPGFISDDSTREPIPEQATGTFILGSLPISGIEWEPGALNPYAEFLHAKPSGNIGGAENVYRGTFDLRGARAVELIAMSGNDLEANPTLAAAEARQALMITPTSVRARLAVARAEQSLKDRSAATSDYEAAIAQARITGSEWYPWEIAEADRALAALRAEK